MNLLDPRIALDDQVRSVPRRGHDGAATRPAGEERPLSVATATLRAELATNVDQQRIGDAAMRASEQRKIAADLEGLAVLVQQADLRSRR